MANIQTYLDNIQQAVYGEEVRGSIHDAIAAMNEESSATKEAATTAQKLDGVEARLNNQISETNKKITPSYTSVKEV